MENSQLIEALEKAVQEAQEELRRRKTALAALKGKDSARKERKSAGPRDGSIPASALAALKEAQKPLSAEEIATRIGKSARDVSVALARYVKQEKLFAKNEEGKYRFAK